ncbi:MAG: ankyrin repeat domain-containing protein [Candidatus Babeliaceae bacterium]
MKLSYFLILLLGFNVSYLSAMREALQAIRNGDKDTLKKLLKEEKIHNNQCLTWEDTNDLYYIGRSLLYYSAKVNHDCMETLVDNGADIHYVDSTYGQPLLNSVINNPTAVKFLLLRQVDPDILAIHPEHGWQSTPLQWAKDPESAELLLRYGANPNFKENRVGGTPLHWRVSDNNKEVAALLLKYGANPYIQTSETKFDYVENKEICEKKSVFDYANNEEMQDLLHNPPALTPSIKTKSLRGKCAAELLKQHELFVATMIATHRGDQDFLNDLKKINNQLEKEYFARQYVRDIIAG